MRRSAPLLAFALLAGCERAEPERAPAAAARVPIGDAACADPAGPARLKALAFERAAALRPAEAALLARLGAATRARLEAPTVLAEDDALDAALCRARLVLDLPQAAADTAGAKPTLAAEIDYAVQRTATGALRLYRIEGDEPLVLRVAELGTRGGERLAAAELPPVPTPAPAPAAVSPPTLPRAERPAAVPPPPVERVRPPAVAVAPSRTVPRPAAPAPRPAPPATVARAEPVRTLPVQPTPGGLDCVDPATRTEEILCANRYLAALDRETALQYYRAFDASGPGARARLRRSRGQFIDRLERCERVSCFESLYEDRIREIDRIAGRR